MAASALCVIQMEICDLEVMLSVYKLKMTIMLFQRALSNSAPTPTHPHSSPPTQNNAPPTPTHPK